MPARWMTWERIVRDEGHHERRVHAGRSTRLLRLARCTAHAGAPDERDAGAPVRQPESDGSRYDDKDMVAQEVFPYIARYDISTSLYIFQGNIIIINIIYNTQSSKTIQHKYHGKR